MMMLRSIKCKSVYSILTLVYNKLYKKKTLITEQDIIDCDMTIKSNRRNNLYESILPLI